MRIWTVIGITVATSAAFDILFSHADHPESWWHTAPAFDVVYGFAGCVALVFFSKWLGGSVSRPESYYEQDEK